jgi:hypothetical protein
VWISNDVLVCGLIFNDIDQNLAFYHYNTAVVISTIKFNYSIVITLHKPQSCPCSAQ